MCNKSVLIVGAGPIGLFLAADLVRYGVSLKVIDKISEPVTFTKALTVNSSTLKVLHGAGMVREVMQNGKILTDAEAYYNGRLVTHLNKKYLQSLYNFFLSIPQPVTEELFRKKIAEIGINVAYSQEIIGLDQDDSGVEVEIKNPETGKVSKEMYDYIVGCDGAHSKVRELAYLTFTGHNYDMYFIVADVLLTDGCVIKKSSYFIDDDGFIGTFLMGTGYTRLVYKVDGFMPRDKPQVTLEEMQAYLDKHMHHRKLTIKEVLWSAGAQIITRTTESGKVGRVFIAGDSYHLFSPVGGHNMNTGFQDAFNLSWKLSYVLQGLAPESLLDTYASERQIAIDKLLEVTNRNTKIVMRRDKTDSKINAYIPNMRNRKYYRTELPYEFAGYFADHSVDDATWEGKHVPYIEFVREYSTGIKSTYDLPILKKFALFVVNEAELAIDYKYNGVLNVFQLLVEDAAKFAKEFNLSRGVNYLIRPDGFVATHGEVTNCFAYIDDYLHLG
jgi:2-polyprenyl-6-methoxyphenol hydroxylase-like FAD-dependent oxidoreductase